jgi:hypothetical protein
MGLRTWVRDRFPAFTARTRVLRTWITYGSPFPALTCNFCGFRARAFLSNRKSKPLPGQPTIDRYHIVAMGTRDNYACPRCGASDKQRLMWEYLKDHVAGKRVLHIAPERQLRAKIEPLASTYRAGDFFFGDPRYFDGRYDGVEHMDVTKLPIADASVDIVICAHVLEHVPDDRKGMREIYRVLAPEGFALLQVPISYELPQTLEGLSGDPETLYGQKDHVRIYGQDYPERLREAGFTLEVRQLTGHGINPEERLYIAKKL